MSGELTSTRDGRAGIAQAGIAQGLILSFATFLPILATLSVAPAIPRLIQHFGDIPNAPVLVTMLLSVPAIFIAITSPFVGSPIKRSARSPTAAFS